jgi:hypothetical protein
MTRGGRDRCDGDISTYAAPAIRSLCRPTRLLAKHQAELAQTRIAWVNNTGLTEENSYIRIDGQASGSSSTTRAGRNTPNIHYHSVYRD